MRLTTKTSIMGRKHDIAYGCASIWKKKLKNDKYELIENAVDKLGQLEDIEEELGIDLKTLFKALNGCYFLQISTKKICSDIRPTLIYQCGWHLKPNLTELPMIYALKDYGKTWALTKEELEK